jgi:hypothetical protein
VAQQHLDPTNSTVVPADAVAGYLRARATEFLRALRTHRETGGGAAAGAEESADAALALRRSARRISGTLHTFRPLLDTDWSESLRPELAWLAGTLGREHAYAARLDRLVSALNRLSGAAPFPAQQAMPARTATVAAGARPAASAVGSRPPAPPDRGTLTVGAAKAGALLDRRLTLARTRAHSAALQALGSSRFHAVADSVAVLASEVPLTPAAPSTDPRPLAAAAHDRLCDAVTGLPLHTAAHPYNAEALVHGLSPDTAPHPQDAPWHQVRLLLRLHRYAPRPSPSTYASSRPARPSTGTATPPRRARPRPRPPAPPGSPRPRPTPSASCTPTSGTRSRPPGSRSSSPGRRKR